MSNEEKVVGITDMPVACIAHAASVWEREGEAEMHLNLPIGTMLG